LLSPFNAHFHVPLLEAAASGSLLTGVGGDEMLGEGRWARAAAVMAGRERPELRDILRLGFALAPSPICAAVLRRREAIPFGWLRPEARREATGRLAAQAASQPVRFGARLAWSRRLRYLDVGVKSLDLLAADARVGIVHPLVDVDFLSALARAGGFAGFATRRDALRAALEDLLPAELYSRSTKVHFDEVFCSRYSRAFVDDWEGDGVDEYIVDVEELRSLWRDGTADTHALALLQAAWLVRESARGSAADRLDEMVGGFAD
jgi:hypothetical protein